MNTVTRNFGEIKMEYRAGNVSFSGSPQLPPVGMKLSEAIAAAKATLAIAFQRLDEISDDDFSIIRNRWYCVVHKIYYDTDYCPKCSTGQD